MEMLGFRKVLLFALCAITYSFGLAAPWQAGFTLTQVTDPVFERELEVAYWYPSEAPSAEETFGPFKLQVALDAQITTEVKGVVLVSHGFAGNFLSHHDTAIYLAQQGFFVVSPSHPDEAGLASGQLALDPLMLRPRHLSLVLDAALEHPDFHAQLTGKPVAVLAHSLGTYAALVKLGAAPSTSGLTGYCASHAQDGLLCSEQARRRLDAVFAEAAFEADRRMSAAVLLAPAYAPVFQTEILAAITTPLKLVVAENDEELSPFHAQHFSKAFQQDAEVIAKAGHYVFLSPCPPSLAQELAFLCLDADGVDRQAVHAQLNQEIATFLEAMLEQP